MKKQEIIPCTLAVALLAAISASTAFAATKSLPPRADLPRQIVSGGNPDAGFHRFIVEYRSGAKERGDRNAVTRSVSDALARSAASVRGKAVTGSYMRRLATGQQLVRTSASLDAAQAAAFMRQLKADPDVVSVRIDRMRHIARDSAAPKLAWPAYVPADPLFDEYQWHFDAPDGGPSYDGGPNYGGANVGAAWDLADGNGVVIAVLDTGITAHPDVNTELADAGYDFITDAFISGRPTDDRVPGGWDQGDWTIGYPGAETCQQRYSSWHGTHVAATAGAERTGNDVGMSGIAYNAKILPLRVLGHCGGYTSDIVDAIVWAAGGTVDGLPANPNPAKVINLSLGGEGACEAVEAEAIAFANSQGATVVIAAGNDNADSDNYSPGNCPGAVTVASNGIGSRRAYYSNYGDGIEISAPGGGVFANEGSSGLQIYDGFVWQAINPSQTKPMPADQIAPDGSNGGYGGLAGTSQASPHVAGVVALMQSARAEAELPALAPDEVLAILQGTATPFEVAPSATRRIGAGIVNAAAAVAKALEPPCEVDCGSGAIPLVNKVAVNGLGGVVGSEVLYSFDAQAGTTLSFMTYGGSGDVSMYVSFDEEPTTAVFDARSVRPGNSETVRFAAPKAGRYYIKLVGTRAYSNVTLVARQ